MLGEERGNGAQIGGYLNPADMLKALEKQNK